MKLNQLATFLSRHRVVLAYTLLVAAVLLLPTPASAYAGEQLVQWSRNYIVAPLALLAIIITIGAALIRPDMAKQAAYIAITAVILLALMSVGDVIITKLQAP